MSFERAAILTTLILFVSTMSTGGDARDRPVDTIRTGRIVVVDAENNPRIELGDLEDGSWGMRILHPSMGAHARLGLADKGVFLDLRGSATGGVLSLAADNNGRAGMSVADEGTEPAVFLGIAAHQDRLLFLKASNDGQSTTLDTERLLIRGGKRSITMGTYVGHNRSTGIQLTGSDGTLRELKCCESSAPRTPD